jgi:transcriptional regulator with PAS, ATPase and Fis domain
VHRAVPGPPDHVSGGDLSPTIPPNSHGDETDPSARFTWLVQSPLRASLVRFLHSRAREAFGVEAFMQRFGRLQQDLENCLRELVAFGVASRTSGTPSRYKAARPGDVAGCQLLDAFLALQRTVSTEERSPAVQRFREMIGSDEKMLIVFEWIRTAAKSDISVLMLGPTGSGKEVVARMIHELSRRGSERFQAVNCAALPDTLFESEMFGHEKGAFTGAHERKPGRIELAHKGTLFLDEIGDLSAMAQAKLLRVLEDRRVERLGGRHAIDVDFRLISATNRPLDQFVLDGRFREDLYYRVNAFSIRLPTLRERASDIPLLAHRLLVRYCDANGLAADSKTIDQGALDRLCSYHWPGNIRELEGTISRAAVSAPGDVIRADDVQFLHPVEPVDRPRARLSSLREAERVHVQHVLDEVAWNKKQAAKILEISRGTLYRKIGEYNLEPRQTEHEPAGAAQPGNW